MTFQQLSQHATQATQRERQTPLTSLVNGVAQQLAIHSVGGVVTGAQSLTRVAPNSPNVSTEVRIANQDIGFVNAGQMAAVKLETCSDTKYGTVGPGVSGGLSVVWRSNSMSAMEQTMGPQGVIQVGLT